MKTVTLSTDGGYDWQTKQGGWGLVLRFKDHCKTASGSVCNTTNNRMEAQAIITGLSMLTEPCRVIVRTDSTVCIYAMEAGLGRRKKAGRKNMDLLLKLWEQMERHEVVPVWVKGHNGDPDNEKCDAMAYHAAKGTAPA